MILNESDVAAEEVLSDIESEHQRAAQEEKEVIETLSEAVKRIEEANLWKTLLGRDVFAPGSARPEILEAVNKKIRVFARQNLELCVGISKKEENKPQQVALPFDKEEMHALKLLAAKVLKRDLTKAVMGEYSPEINQVEVAQSDAEPKMNTAKIKTEEQKVKVNAVKSSKPTQPSSKSSATSTAKPPPTNRPVSSSGKTVHTPPPTYTAPSSIPNPVIVGDSSLAGLGPGIDMQSLVGALVSDAIKK